ncbi:aryl-alcohol dehydrogenase-like predicted oxidoreductase [Lutibacter sp. Hel_I_33_5]|uniref:aldo/keto reductase n=1 Tax=Lutibacter sp. Hel_I_33_5 TaxID=1566289 RepID=UPI0011A0A540|nr:aldo/keto reductase [Lutibacter sp. Hel_I_33_5]TVZ56197.1 aryl-alcohol dehydrogenase-like predicted oxidoreductase [Lutibacter sp. Hel_I_33_5]
MIENKLILGTVQFGLNYGINNQGGKPSSKRVKEILDTAFENKIKILDTAEAYGDSQKVIGEYHRKSKNAFQIITKFSASVKFLPSNIRERVLKNLEILQIDSLYCYMFHSFSDFKTYFAKYRKELLVLKKEKIIRKIGVSIYSNNELEEVLKFNEVEVIQLPFNLLDNKSKRGEIISKAKKKEIEIHTRSVFLQGLFFKKTDEFHGNLIRLKSSIIKLKNLCCKGYEMNDLALNYVYQQKNINNVLIGVDTVQQLQQNLYSINKSISKKQIETIDNINFNETELLNPSNWKL